MRTQLDGVLLGDDAGGLWQVFAPRWWQVGRWWAWLRAPEKGRVLVGGKPVRVLRAARRLAPWLAAPDAPVVPVDLPWDG